MEFLAQFHPKVVHFPIALLLTYTLLEAVGAFFKKELFTNAAYILLILGTLGAVAAMITGNQAALQAEVWDDIGLKLDDAQIPFKMIREHEEYASIVLWLFAALLVARTWFVIQVQVKKKFEKHLNLYRYAFVAIAAVGCFFIYETGEHGGKLVYKSGVGTELIKPDSLSGKPSHDD